MKKILSLTLAVMMVVSMIPTAFAAEAGGNWAGGTQVEATGSRTTIEDDGSATHDVEYTITVPAKLAPAGSGTVTLEGMWPSDATVKVTADPSVEMVNSINSADKKTLAVTFTPIELAGNNTVAVSDDETVSVADISAALFGTWSGKFNYNVDYVAGSGSTGGDSGTTEPEDPDDGGSTVTPGEGQISFTIDGVSYLADEGMTFDEWAESEYNADGFEFKAIYRPAQGVTGEMNMTALLDADNKNAVGWIVNGNMFVIKSGHIVNENHGTLELISLTDLNYLLKVPVENITFTINGTEYQAEEGITWREWIETENNVLGIRLSDNGKWLVWGDVGGGAIVKYGAVPDGATDVLSDDVIDTNGTYSFAVD